MASLMKIYEGVLSRLLNNASLCFCKSVSYATTEKYDVIVVGGGHAGCEAAHASARMGCSTLLLTHKISTIGEMSCNPSFGGIGKGHLIKEIDALDGVCGRICDKSGIHYKILNRTKGPAVWGPRAQIDRGMYKNQMQEEILNTNNLTVMESSVDNLIIDKTDSNEKFKITDSISKCSGVILENGQQISSTCVVLTTGTFLRGQINIGLERVPAGRKGDAPAIKLADTLENLGFKIGRLKTGTPPRLLASSVNFKPFTTWKPDSFSHPFSFMNENVWISPENQLDCYTVPTGAKVKDIVHKTLHLNSHVNEEINGPRYCPSIESKILKFPDRTHMLWVEPEELDTKILYLQGFSCTMPEEYQLEAVRSIEGLENAEITQPGYGVEYDYMDPRQITPALETKKVQGLFFAGQINGTTGYEEAAAQGIIAGINAGRKSQRKPFFYLNRSDGYIGVLIDDLTTHGTNEPYRMFTSRAEFRLSLRPDNADMRLTLKAYEEAGCVSEKRKLKTEKTQCILTESEQFLKTVKMKSREWSKIINVENISATRAISAFELLSQFTGVTPMHIYKTFPNELKPVIENKLLQERLETISLYDRVVHRQLQEIEELKKEENMMIPENFDYSKIVLKVELCEKLAQSRPVNIAAASRIQGMTPTALIYLINYIRNFRYS
ncbi:5-taurinomethyluridine-[tRNA] synthase subunit MTO1, mitochondrial-like [Styela clava]